MDNFLRSWILSHENWMKQTQVRTSFDDAKTVLNVMPLATSVPFWDQNQQEILTLHRVYGSAYFRQTAGQQN